METDISNFHIIFYIPTIQKLAFHILHVQIMGTNHCGDSRRTVFKRLESFQDVLCHRDYAERVVASFSHQIQLDACVNFHRMCAVRAELGINTRRHITAVKPLQPVFVSSHAHKLIKNVFLSYDCQFLINYSPPPHTMVTISIDKLVESF